MKALSLKLDDDIFQQTEDLMKELKVPRNRYINKAIDFYNKYNKRRILETQLRKESNLVAEDSMEILSEFESLGNVD